MSHALFPLDGYYKANDHDQPSHCEPVYETAGGLSYER